MKHIKHIPTFEEFLNESSELTQADYKHYYPIIGHKGLGLEFNFNGKSIGGYVVPKQGEDLDAIIAQIERGTSRKLTAIPYDQERMVPVSGTKAGWTRGKNEIWLQIIKK